MEPKCIHCGERTHVMHINVDGDWLCDACYEKLIPKIYQGKEVS